MFLSFLIFVALSVVTFILCYSFILPKLLLRKFPGPPPLSYIKGHVDLFSTTKLSAPRLICELVQKYGHVFQLFFFHRRVLVLSNPQDVRFVLSTKNYSKAASFASPLGSFLGNDSLMVSEDCIHDLHRQAIKGTFNATFMTAVSSHVEEELVDFLKKMDERCGFTCFDFDSDLLALFRCIQGKIVCGISSHVENEDVLTSIDACMRRVSVLQRFYPFSSLPPSLFPVFSSRCNRQTDVCRRWIAKVIEERIAEPNASADRHKDLLDILLAVPSMSRECVGNQLLTFFSAGIHTTARKSIPCISTMTQRLRADAKLCGERLI